MLEPASLAEIQGNIALARFALSDLGQELVIEKPMHEIPGRKYLAQPARGNCRIIRFVRKIEDVHHARISPDEVRGIEQADCVGTFARQSGQQSRVPRYIVLMRHFFQSFSERRLTRAFPHDSSQASNAFT